jgi:hypothetical protein
MQKHEELAAHGFHLVLKDRGPDLEWVVRLKNKTDVMFNGEELERLKTMPERELRSMVRRSMIELKN